MGLGALLRRFPLSIDWSSLVTLSNMVQFSVKWYLLLSSRQARHAPSIRQRRTDAVFAHLAPLEWRYSSSRVVRPAARHVLFAHDPPSSAAVASAGGAVCLICRSYWGNIAGHKFTAFECRARPARKEETLYDSRVDGVDARRV